MSTSPSPVAIQRNGKQRACEPCRRRKVACDHTYPVCYRCQRRSEQSACFYIGENTSATATTTTTATAKPREKSPGVRRPSPQAVQSPRDLSISQTYRRRAARPQHSDENHGGHSRNQASLPSTPLSSAGYLGPTSFSALLEKTQPSLTTGTSPLGSSVEPYLRRDYSWQSQLHPQSPEPAYTPTALLDGEDAPIYSQKLELERAIYVLRQLPHTEGKALELFDRNVNPNDCWMRLAARTLISSVWQTFEPCLSDRAQEKGLCELAGQLNHNAQRSLLEDVNLGDGLSWLEPFSGPNLRWETLAVVFVYLLLGATAFSLPGMDRRGLFVKYKECCSICISLANSRSNANVLLAYALYKRSTFQASISGDANLDHNHSWQRKLHKSADTKQPMSPPYSPIECMNNNLPGLANWKDHAEAVAMLTFLGMHVQTNPTTGPYIPSSLLEVRRRLFCQVFIIDKVTAMFCGRPPLLAWKYCTTPLPLDIDDEALVCGGSDLDEAMRSLDQSGWNSDGGLRSSTIIRARTLIAIIREEILEIVLGHHDVTPQEHVLQLEIREIDTYSSFPPHIVYDSNHDLRETPPALTYARLLIRLEHLLNLFFLKRILSIETGSSTRELIAVSFEMISLTVIYWTHKDQLAGLHGEYELFVIAYAASAAGVLCNELQNAASTLDTLEASTAVGVTVTRSLVIQQLSLLIGCLDWIGPAQPNTDLAEVAKKVIRHVLDETLNRNTSSSNHTPYVDPGIGDYFNLDILDTYDWLRTDINEMDISQT